MEIVTQSINDFWKLLASSKLLTVPAIKLLAADFAHEKHAAPATPKSLAQWLMNHRAISKYQATVLLAGRPGPFFFGGYKVYERIEKGPLKGCLRAVHDATKHPVFLRFFDAEHWPQARDNAQAAIPIRSP